MIRPPILRGKIAVRRDRRLTMVAELAGSVNHHCTGRHAGTPSGFIAGSDQLGDVQILEAASAERLQQRQFCMTIAVVMVG
jgi:hypothetical protein